MADLIKRKISILVAFLFLYFTLHFANGIDSDTSLEVEDYYYYDEETGAQAFALGMEHIGGASAFPAIETVSLCKMKNASVIIIQTYSFCSSHGWYRSEHTIIRQTKPENGTTFVVVPCFQSFVS